MTDPDVLERSIREHQEWQRTAWQHLSKPALTTFESRELRNQIKQSSAELRRYLDMRSERLRAALAARATQLAATPG
jgi:histidinol-phosphate/aromatic aminotransferase/cobyric acid decarboxylase-like protein